MADGPITEVSPEVIDRAFGAGSLTAANMRDIIVFLADNVDIVHHIQVQDEHGTAHPAVSWAIAPGVAGVVNSPNVWGGFARMMGRLAQHLTSSQRLAPGRYESFERMFAHRASVAHQEAADWAPGSINGIVCGDRAIMLMGGSPVVMGAVMSPSQSIRLYVAPTTTPLAFFAALPCEVAARLWASAFSGRRATAHNTNRALIPLYYMCNGVMHSAQVSLRGVDTYCSNDCVWAASSCIMYCQEATHAVAQCIAGTLATGTHPPAVFDPAEIGQFLSLTRFLGLDIIEGR